MHGTTFGSMIELIIEPNHRELSLDVREKLSIISYFLKEEAMEVFHGWLFADLLNSSYHTLAFIDLYVMLYKTLEILDGKVRTNIFKDIRNQISSNPNHWQQNLRNSLRKTKCI